jgi:hypothetical protein
VTSLPDQKKSTVFLVHFTFSAKQIHNKIYFEAATFSLSKMSSTEAGAKPTMEKNAIDISGTPVPVSSSEASDATLVEDTSLPPRDRGMAAWTCLAAISVISMITWGKLPLANPFSAL